MRHPIGVPLLYPKQKGIPPKRVPPIFGNPTSGNSHVEFPEIPCLVQVLLLDEAISGLDVATQKLVEATYGCFRYEGGCLIGVLVFQEVL